MNALPSPKPKRQKRLALRFAVLVAAASVLGATYWFTRPSDLVWWRSPAFGKSGRHLRVLVPAGWQVDLTLGGYAPPYCLLGPVDGRPWILRRLLPAGEEPSYMLTFFQETDPGQTRFKGRVFKFVTAAKQWQAERRVEVGEGKIRAGVTYVRTNRWAFDRTQSKICNSLTIE